MPRRLPDYPLGLQVHRIVSEVIADAEKDPDWMVFDRGTRTYPWMSALLETLDARGVVPHGWGPWQAEFECDACQSKGYYTTDGKRSVCFYCQKSCPDCLTPPPEPPAPLPHRPGTTLQAIEDARARLLAACKVPVQYLQPSCLTCLGAKVIATGYLPLPRSASEFAGWLSLSPAVIDRATHIAEQLHRSLRPSAAFRGVRWTFAKPDRFRQRLDALAGLPESRPNYTLAAFAAFAKWDLDGKGALVDTELAMQTDGDWRFFSALWNDLRFLPANVTREWVHLYIPVE